MTPEQAGHELREAVVRIPGGFMTDAATFARGGELGFEGLDFYAAGRAGVLGEVPADVVVAGWRSLPEPEPVKALALHRLNALRELRGALHGAAVLTVGLTPVEAIVVRTPAMLSVFGWAEPYPEPKPLHDRWGLAEARTDRMFGRNLAVLDDEERTELVGLLAPLAEPASTTGDASAS